MRPSFLRTFTDSPSTATTIHSSDRNPHQLKSKAIISQSQSHLHWLDLAPTLKGYQSDMDLIYDKNYEWYDELEGFSKKIQPFLDAASQDFNLWGPAGNGGLVYVLRCLPQETSDRLYSYIMRCQPTFEDPHGRKIIMRHPTDEKRLYIIQLEGCTEVLDDNPETVEHPERLTPDSIPYNDAIVLHSLESLRVLIDRLELAHKRNAGYGPLVFHGMAGHYIEDDPNRYDLGFNVSATEPLASTVYGIRDVHLVELTYDLGDGGVNSNHDAGDGPDSAYRLIW